MQVKVVKGKAVVKLFGPDKTTLANAEAICDFIARNDQDEAKAEAQTALDALKKLRARYPFVEAKPAAAPAAK
jgi:hypothetical protein